jgi:hypothetical protein
MYRKKDAPRSPFVTFDQAPIIDRLIDHLHLRNDAALCRQIRMAPPTISKYRNNKLALGATFLVGAQYLTGWSLDETIAKLGLPKNFLRTVDHVEPEAQPDMAEAV